MGCNIFQHHKHKVFSQISEISKLDPLRSLLLAIRVSVRRNVLGPLYAKKIEISQRFTNYDEPMYLTPSFYNATILNVMNFKYIYSNAVTHHISQCIAEITKKNILTYFGWKNPTAAASH